MGPATIRQAVSELVRLDKIETIPGSGTFIAPKLTHRVAAPVDTAWQTLALGSDTSERSVLDPLVGLVPAGVIDLASGYPDSTLQPTALIAGSVREAARRPGTFGRSASEGLGPLRDWFEEQIDPERRHRVLIMPGGQAALSLIFRVLCLPGDVILMESPTYAGALVAARAAGLTPMPVAVDGNGMDIDQLEETLAQSGARVLYVQPRFQNPTGATLSVERRRRLMELADRYHVIIIEDDWLADLAVPGRSTGLLAGIDPDGHVVHLRSLTKSIAPGIRVAAIGAVGAIANRLHQVRASEDFFVSPLLQETALGVVTSTRWPGHLRKLRSSLLDRRQFLQEQVQKVPGLSIVQSDGDGTSSPLHLWINIGGHDGGTTVSDQAVREAGLRHGVSIVAGGAWYPGTSDRPRVRLSNAAVGHDGLELGVERLAAALDELAVR